MNNQFSPASSGITAVSSLRKRYYTQSSIFLLVWLVAIFIIAALSSCDSPLIVDTPRTAVPKIVWETKTDAYGVKTTEVASVDGIEPEAVFELYHSTWQQEGFGAPTTATVGELRHSGNIRVLYQPSVPTRKAISIALTEKAGSVNIMQLDSYLKAGGTVQFYIPPAIANTNWFSKVDITAPVHFSTPGYQLSDSTMEFLGSVRLTSPEPITNPFNDNTIIRRGEPLNVQWINNITNADIAEVELYGWLPVQVNHPNGVSVGSITNEVEIKKTVSPKGMKEIQFSAEEINKLPANGRYTLRVKYTKVKTVNSGKAVFLSISYSDATGSVK